MENDLKGNENYFLSSVNGKFELCGVRVTGSRLYYFYKLRGGAF